MKKVFFPLISACLFWRLSAADLAVAARISETGVTEDGRQACVVQAEVKNQTASPIEIAMLTCSWSDSWIVTPEDAIEIPVWPCDGNVPDHYLFQPGGGYSFRFSLQARTRLARIEGLGVRLGFLFVKWEAKNPSLLFEPREELLKRFPIIWSAEVVVPKTTGKLIRCIPERKILPNQPPEATPGQRPPATPSQSSGAPQL